MATIRGPERAKDGKDNAIEVQVEYLDSGKIVLGVFDPETEEETYSVLLSRTAWETLRQ